MTGSGVQRSDFAAIANWIKPEARVLDLGCADGSLLRYLAEQRGSIGYGVEIDDERVHACVSNGVNVIQGDMERGLEAFADDSFDYVILSQTLQVVRHPSLVLREMLRVGTWGVMGIGMGFVIDGLFAFVLRGRVTPSFTAPRRSFAIPPGRHGIIRLPV